MTKIILASCLILSSVSLVEASPKKNHGEIVFAKTRIFSNAEMLSIEKNKTTNKKEKEKIQIAPSVIDWNTKVTQIINSQTKNN